MLVPDIRVVPPPTFRERIPTDVMAPVLLTSSLSSPGAEMVTPMYPSPSGEAFSRTRWHEARVTMRCHPLISMPFGNDFSAPGHTCVSDVVMPPFHHEHASSSRFQRASVRAENKAIT